MRERGEMMTELFRQWCEIEPERCKPDPESEKCYLLFIEDRWSSVHYDPVFIGEDAFIQWVVQQAVEARGWAWLINKLMLDVGYRASVHTSLESSEMANGATPTEALLSAYLKALSEVTTPSLS